MKHNVTALAIILSFCPFMGAAAENEDVQKQIQKLQQQTLKLQDQLVHLQKQLKQRDTSNVKVAPRQPETSAAISVPSKQAKKNKAKVKTDRPPAGVHSSAVTVHQLDNHPESLEFYPTALVADEQIVTYIAGTPVISSPYLGSRPAFDGSDYIVNISSINRDIRLMQQRRRLFRAYKSIGYSVPHRPIIAISGKVEPLAKIGSGNLFFSGNSGDVTLGASELDVAAILNDKVEAYMALSVDTSPPDVGGQRLSNSSVDLNMGFVNIGDLDKTPLYFTGGQLYVPFGRYSSSMVSAPLTMILARTKSRPFILGYKSQHDSGPFAAIYGYKSDTNFSGTAVGGLNFGYVYDTDSITGELGGSFISSINDAGGMQFTGSAPGLNTGTFGGFSSPTNGNETVKKVPALGIHGYVNIDRYSFTAEWVSAGDRFRVEDLSFNGAGARPQAGQLEGSVTFIAFNKPSSFSIGYQWSTQALALNLPKQRVSGVFNISIWKDTVESLEYRHDINYSTNTYANGAAPAGYVNANTFGPGGATDTILAQIGVYF